METKEFTEKEPISASQTNDLAKQQMDEMLEKGVEIKIPRKGIDKLLHRGKDQLFVINELHAGTIIRIAGVFLEMEINEKELANDPLAESKRLSYKGLQMVARVLAIAMLGNSPLRYINTERLTKNLLWRIKPSNLVEYALLVNTMCNFGDFINSFRLMSATIKAASPILKEQNKKD